MERKKLQQYKLLTALSNLRNEINISLSKKGDGVFASSHEILGVITEEYQELIFAVQATSKESTPAKREKQKKDWITDELYDIAAACIIGIASINDVDWL